MMGFPSGRSHHIRPKAWSRFCHLALWTWDFIHLSQILWMIFNHPSPLGSPSKGLAYNFQSGAKLPMSKEYAWLGARDLLVNIAIISLEALSFTNNCSFPENPCAHLSIIGTIPRLLEVSGHSRVNVVVSDGRHGAEVMAGRHKGVGTLLEATTHVHNFGFPRQTKVFVGTMFVGAT